VKTLKTTSTSESHKTVTSKFNTKFISYSCSLNLYIEISMYTKKYIDYSSVFIECSLYKVFKFQDSS